MLPPDIRKILDAGVAIPASPLALNSARKLDERRQRAVYRYYSAAGAGGIAVGVHTTQFAIRDPKIGLFEPVLSLAAEEMDRLDVQRRQQGVQPLLRIAGVCGKTSQAVAEAKLAVSRGYHAGLLSLAAMKDAGDGDLVAHARSVADVIPIIGFYLQTAVGGRVLPFAFWRKLAEVENLVAIKMAPFNRYQTLDVVRAIVEAGRHDVALYTGNDDNIVADLITPYRLRHNGRVIERRIVGGLLGHWSVWTRKAVELLETCHRAVSNDVAAGQSDAAGLLADLIALNIEVTDSNAAFFDAANDFAGCITGLHEVLRRQGLFEGVWCLDPHETFGPGQRQEIERIYRAYPHLNDDDFVAEHRDAWLSG